MDPKNMTSIWQEKHFSHIWKFICPICKTHRQLPFHPRPGQPIHFVQVGLTAAFFTLVTWNWFTWKGLVSFIPFWGIFELAYRSRTRALLPCKDCGFDPYLYFIDPQLAKKEVEEYWRKKFAEKGIPYPEPQSTWSNKKKTQVLQEFLPQTESSKHPQKTL